MKNRDPLTATLLSLFVPFYILYWLVQTGKTLTDRGAQVPSPLLLFSPFFALLAFMIGIGFGTASGGDEGGLLMAVMFAVVLPLAIILTLVYYYKFSVAAEQATKGALSKVLLFILFWFVSPAAVFLIQEKLNSLDPASSPSK
jgi:hypothetical protein